MKSIEEFADEQLAKQTYVIFVDPVYEAIIATVEFCQRWIPVEEELPKNNSVVLARSTSPNKPTTAFYSNGFFTCDFSGLSHERITHWRPIQYPVSSETLSDSEKE